METRARRGTPWLRTLGLALLFAASGRAEEPAGTLEVRTLERVNTSGSFLRLTDKALAYEPAQGGGAAEVPLADLREIAFRGAPPPAPTADRLRVTLVSGEELLAERWGPVSGGLKLSSPSFGTLDVPLEALRSLVPLPAKVGLCHDPASRPKPVPGSDHVRLVSGDEVSGTIAEVKPQGLALQQDGGRTLTLAWSDLLVAHLDNPDAPAASGARAEIETRTGDLLLAAAGVQGDVARGFALTLAADKSLAARVPVGAVRLVRWRGGRCVDATTLPFTSVYKPPDEFGERSLTDLYLASDRGARVGRRPRGCPLRLAGTVYRHGFAVHSGSEIRLPLGGKFRTFEVIFGIDDEAREGAAAGRVPVAGNVDARVVGDGKVLWEAKGVTGAAGEQPRSVGPLSVENVKELVLVVDAEGTGDTFVQETFDRATWAEPLLLR
jgi:hypothetical protein